VPCDTISFGRGKEEIGDRESGIASQNKQESKKPRQVLENKQFLT
jgi:hypothetical protein